MAAAPLPRTYPHPLQAPALYAVFGAVTERTRADNLASFICEQVTMRIPFTIHIFTPLHKIVMKLAPESLGPFIHFPLFPGLRIPYHELCRYTFFRQFSHHFR